MVYMYTAEHNSILGGKFTNTKAQLRPRIIMFRKLRDGNPCLKGQLEDLKHVGKTTFWKI